MRLYKQVLTILLLLSPFACAHDYPGASLYDGRAFRYPDDIADELQNIDNEVWHTEQLDNIDFNRAAYQYAFTDSDGMKMPYQSDAREFSDKLTELSSRSRAIALVTHKYAFRYAFREEGGMKMPYWSDAKDFADLVSKRSGAAQFVIVHRLAFKYAFREDDGMKMPYWSDAKDFADKVAAREDGLDVLRLHRKAFKYAFRDADGLKMPYWSDAKDYADKQSGLAPR